MHLFLLFLYLIEEQTDNLKGDRKDERGCWHITYRDNIINAGAVYTTNVWGFLLCISCGTSFNHNEDTDVFAESRAKHTR